MIFNVTFLAVFVGYFYVALSHMAMDGSQHSHESGLVDSTLLQDERSHMEHHMNGVVDSSSLNRMSEEEVKFLYFTMHDSDENNKLDGCELVNSLLHWHMEEHKAMGVETSHAGTTRIFSNDELSVVIDPILCTDDKNFDSFIDYPEFIAASKSRGF